MKTNEELNALKNEVETLNENLAGLSAEELAQVFGGRKGHVYKTNMECSSCGHKAVWCSPCEGTYVGKTTRCPSCGECSFKGLTEW